MQTARKIRIDEKDFSENFIEFKLKSVEKKREKTIEDDKEKACFQTDERYFCKDYECKSSGECKKLIATWMR